MSMTGTISKSEVLSGPERRRRWTPAEKLALVAETYEPGMSVSLVARRHGIAPNQLFYVAPSGEPGCPDCDACRGGGCPASDYRALQNQIRELHRLLGKKTLEAEILKEALDVAAGPKKHLLRSLSWPKDGSR